MKPEVWLRGPIEGVEPLLMPVAHALLQAREDLESTVSDITSEELWLRPGGAASIGYHVRHIAGSIDRLLTYAQGKSLSQDQFKVLKQEQEQPETSVDAYEILELANSAIDQALRMVRDLQREDLLTTRLVGRAGLPSNTLGLLFHIAEHTTRHVGQIITTKKILRGYQSIEENAGR